MKKQDARQIAIVGAGPAGLVAALVAKKLGFEVRVFEQAPDFARIGGGILIHSNGQRVLESLGLLESFEPQMVAVTKAIVQGYREKVIAEVDFTEIDVPHNRIAVVWRYQLQEHLLKAARQAGIEVSFNHRLEKLEFEGRQAILHFENGEAYQSDIVIAADGVNSRTRESAGMDFRKVAIGEGWLRGSSEIKLSNTTFREIWGDDGRRFGIAPLTEGKTYFYARVPLGEWEDIRENRLDEWMNGWQDFGQDAIKILHNVRDWKKVNYSELFEIHAEDWAKPPVFLVGDAAHSMTPNVGQGANSAMVDASVLVQMLGQARENGKDLAEVGREYTALRRPFVTKIQTAARRGGALASGTSATSHFLRDAFFAASRNIGFLRRQSLTLSAGYHPPENEFFTPFAANAHKHP
jgi:2-polyprenyl-6-methoxyphenol hydroxylase-like FAD-dependent oxidoreductase